MAATAGQTLACIRFRQQLRALRLSAPRHCSKSHRAEGLLWPKTPHLLAVAQSLPHTAHNGFLRQGVTDVEGFWLYFCSSARAAARSGHAFMESRSFFSQIEVSIVSLPVFQVFTDPGDSGSRPASQNNRPGQQERQLLFEQSTISAEQRIVSLSEMGDGKRLGPVPRIQQQ